MLFSSEPGTNVTCNKLLWHLLPFYITSSSSVNIFKTKYILLGKLLIESFIYFNDCQICDDDFQIVFTNVKSCKAPLDACRKGAIKLFIIIITCIIIIIIIILACDGFHK